MKSTMAWTLLGVPFRIFCLCELHQYECAGISRVSMTQPSSQPVRGRDLALLRHHWCSDVLLNYSEPRHSMHAAWCCGAQRAMHGAAAGGLTSLPPRERSWIQRPPLARPWPPCIHRGSCHPNMDLLSPAMTRASTAQPRPVCGRGMFPER